jgi:outer membrane protein assembly factor BamB/serine/threonine protein kinase
VKILTSPLLDDDSRRRFERECRALGSLSSHPNIVTLHAAGTTDDDRPYLIMDYLPGGSLAARVAASPLEWQEVTEIGVKLAGALAAAHEQGILHRDIKPENILISAYGEPQLADFGVAKIQGGTTTTTGSITGSLAHASPEVISGVQATVASDIWSLASTLSTLIAGHPPFYRQGDETLTPLITRILTQTPQDLRPFWVPDEFCQLLEAGLAKDSWERPQTALDFGHSLQDVQRALGLAATAMAAVGGVRTVNPPQAPASSTASPVVAPTEPDAEDLIASTGRLPDEPEPTPETATRRRVAPGTPPPPVSPTPREQDEHHRSLWRRPADDAPVSMDGVSSDSGSYLPPATAAPPAPQPTPRAAATSPTKPAELPIGLRRLRGVSRSWLARGALAALLVLLVAGAIIGLGHHGNATPAAGHLQWSVATSRPIASVRGPAVADGMVVFASQDHLIRAVDEVKGTSRWQVDTGDVVFSSPVADNQVVYVGGDDGKVRALALSNGHLNWSFATGGKVESSPAVAGGSVYVGSDDGHLYALDAGTGHPRWSAALGGTVFSSPAVAGDIVVVGSTNGDVVGLNTTDGTVRWRTKTGGAVFSSPAIAGDSVYVGSNDHHVYALRLQDGGQLWSFPANDLVSSSPAAGDGAVYVGSFDHNVYSLLTPTGGERWRFTTGGDVFSSPKVDNGIVYVGSHDGMLHALDSARGKEIWNFKAQGIVGATPTVANGMVFVGSDDGRLYALTTGRKSK